MRTYDRTSASTADTTANTMPVSATATSLATSTRLRLRRDEERRRRRPEAELLREHEDAEHQEQAAARARAGRRSRPAAAGRRARTASPRSRRQHGGQHAQATSAERRDEQPQRQLDGAQLQQLRADEGGHAAASFVVGSGELQEDVLEPALLGEPVQDDAAGGGDLADGRGAGRDASSSADSSVTPWPASRSRPARRAASGLRTRVPPLASPLQLADAALPDQPAAGQDEHVVDGLLDLRQHVAGHQHGAALGGQAAQEAAQPADALRVEAVGGLVEHEHGRVAEQGRGQAEPLAHAEREAADVAAGVLRQPDELAAPGRGGRPAGRPRWRAPAGGCGRCGRGGSRSPPAASPPARVGSSSSSYRLPSKVAVPEVGATSPSSMRSEVVFPAPFGPRKPVTAPGRTGRGQPVDGQRRAEALGQPVEVQRGAHGAPSQDHQATLAEPGERPAT